MLCSPSSSSQALCVSDFVFRALQTTLRRTRRKTDRRAFACPPSLSPFLGLLLGAGVLLSFPPLLFSALSGWCPCFPASFVFFPSLSLFFLPLSFLPFLSFPFLSFNTTLSATPTPLFPSKRQGGCGPANQNRPPAMICIIRPTPFRVHVACTLYSVFVLANGWRGTAPGLYNRAIKRETGMG